MLVQVAERRSHRDQFHAVELVAQPRKLGIVEYLDGNLRALTVSNDDQLRAFGHTVAVVSQNPLHSRVHGLPTAEEQIPRFERRLVDIKLVVVI